MDECPPNFSKKNLCILYVSFPKLSLDGLWLNKFNCYNNFVKNKIMQSISNTLDTQVIYI